MSEVPAPPWDPDFSQEAVARSVAESVHLRKGPDDLDWQTVLEISKIKARRRAQAAIEFEERRANDDRATRLISSQAFRNRPEEPWLVRDALPPRGISQFYGPPFHGKSLLTLDLALSLANESVTDWFGRKIEQHGDVVIVLQEGDFHYEHNIGAWLQAHDGTNDDHLWLHVRESVDLCSEESVKWLREDIEAVKVEEKPIEPVLVVVDTQSRAMPSANENSASDFNRACWNMERHIITRFNTLVALVHHPGWDDSRERGSSAQRGNVETKAVVKDRNLRFEKTRGIPEEHMLRANFRIDQWPVLEGGNNGAFIRQPSPGEVVTDFLNDELARINTILQVVADAEEPLTKTEITRRAEIGKAVGLRLIDDLLAEGRLAPAGKKIDLGSG